MKDKVKAVILVGGHGTRLRRLTYNTPKPMVPVLNMPFLEYVIRNLRGHNILDIILAQYYLAESMENYFGDGSKFGVKLRYVMEGSPRGTAGAVKNVEKYLDDTFLVLNGDIFHNCDFTNMVKFHHRHRAKATIALTPVEDPTIYGVVETDRRGKVKHFFEKPEPGEVSTNMINAGTYVLEPEVLQWIPPDTKYSFERELFPQMLTDDKPVYTYSFHNYWMDMGTAEKYLQLHRDLLSDKCDNHSLEKDVIIGDKCNIHSSAQFSGSVIIGDNCTFGRGVRLAGPVVIGPNCAIMEDAVIADSVVWDNVTMNTRAVIKSSVVANNCILGSDSYLVDAVLGDHVTVDEGCKLKPGARILPGGTVKDT
ncbi:MAG: NDP-sugar synthase [Chloroflexi bacterium]|nr:NDP-sugar synthase [Chloroflexota bacterium]